MTPSVPANRGDLRRALDLATRVAWVLFLVTLPVTSFPFLPPIFGGEALVRPLTLYPLTFLIPLVVIPRGVKRTLPRTLLPLLAFALIATASSLLSLGRGIDAIPSTLAIGVSVTERITRGLLTLGIGCGFYLAVALTPESHEDLRATLRWIYLGAIMALTWGSLQAFYILHFDQGWFDLLSQIQSYISSRRLFIERISGMTFEPNWFAEQIILLWLPWLFASALWDYSAFRWRWRRLTVEWLLLGWCVLLLPFTFSRAGVLNLIILSVLSLLLFRPFKQAEYPKDAEEPVRRRSLGWALNLLILVVLVAVLVGIIFLVGTKSTFFARIWEYWEQEDANLAGYLNYIGFAPRLIYSQTAVNIFQAYPIMGVGLGNYAFYFEEMLPYRPIALVPEVLHVVTQMSGRIRLITAKNFFLRLLAETGMVGTVVFLSFIIANLGSALFLRLSPRREPRFWGSAGLIGLIALGLSTLTFDSFAFPNMWVLLGLITAATRIESQRKAW